jgi:hypothetical protein
MAEDTRFETHGANYHTILIMADVLRRLKKL